MLNIPYEVKRALRKGDMRKNYKMKVNDVDPDTGERTYSFTIDNDTLVSESVKIDERMVTGKELKFGLCEGSSLEFQYFDHPNINGKDVQVYCSVEYVDGNGDVAWYDIPMGWYSVDQCPMQWETGIYKVTAYNKLKSKYLDAKANQKIEDIIAESGGSMPLYDVIDGLLDSYAIEREYICPTFTINTNYTTYPDLVSKKPIHKQQNGSRWICSLNYVKVVPDNLNPLKSYRVRIRAKELFDTVIDDINNNFVYASTYFSRYAADEGGYYKPAKLVELTFIPFFVGIYDSNDNVLTRIYINYPTIQTKEVVYTQRVTDIAYIGITIPTARSIASLFGSSASFSDAPTVSDSAIETYKTMSLNQDTPFIGEGKLIQIEELDTEAIEQMSVTTADAEAWADVTLRELQSAVYETVCQYGQLNRETDLFEGVELNQSGLYPAETLYPNNALYPLGTMEHPFPSTYSKLWTDTVGEQSFRYLIITYKAMENGQEVEKTLQRTVNADGTTNYNMSDNWLFRNLIWTAADVGDYADAMVLKMKDIRWFPFEMWCAGLPYVETGDAIEITDKQGNTHTSYVLTRTLDGIHNLQDTFINGELDIF